MAQQLAILPYANVTLKTDVARQVQYYLAENANLFPAVTVQKVYLRNYPLGGLAAQLFGTVGPINAQEVGQKAYRGISPTAIIGQSGLEAAYDHFLRGTDGAETVQIDAFGQPTGQISQKPPVAGHNLALSLDEKLQRVGQNALQNSLNTNPGANAGAFVAMNPQDGSIYAMGSLPTYNPNLFTSNLSQAQYNRLISASSNYPLINRAIDSAGPTGSTFKPITATAALQSGNWTTSSIYNDTGSFCTSPGVCRRNAGGAVNGPLDLVNAIRVSSDTFFYNLGARTNVANPLTQPRGGPLQKWARKFGIGQATGIDLPGELSGTLPSPAWRAHRDQLELDCEHATGPYKGKPKHANCGIADGRPWSIGDNINLAVGQGDVQVTPLQLAVAYAAIANGGTIVRPHVGLSIQNQDGTVLQKHQPPGLAAHQHQPCLPGHDPAGSARRRLPARRHVGRRVRQVPRAGLRQDRHRAVHRAERLLLVRLLRARHRDQQAHRRRRARRARRLWRRRGRPRGAPDPLSMVLRQAGPVCRGELQDTMSSRTIQAGSALGEPGSRAKPA